MMGGVGHNAFWQGSVMSVGPRRVACRAGTLNFSLLILLPVVSRSMSLGLNAAVLAFNKCYNSARADHLSPHGDIAIVSGRG
jgi:hypothetical protein